LFLNREYTRALVKSPVYEKIDIFDGAYVGRVFLYICCGLLDSMWQTTAYWLMGAMSNNPAKLAHFSGFCEFFLLLFFLLCSFFVRKG
jgi:hypothetical protein